MKLFLGLSTFAFLLSPGNAELTIVQARVEEVTPAPAPPDTRDELDKLEGVQSPKGGNKWVAKFKIEHVFVGDPSLVGQFMYESTMDDLPSGNSNPIVPRLKRGDEGIFGIKRLANGILTQPAWGRPTFPEGQLPLIKGRHAGYERAIARLVGKANDEEPGNTPSTDRAPGSTAPWEAAAAKASPQTILEASEVASESSRLWIVGGIFLIVLVTAYLIFRLKRT